MIVYFVELGVDWMWPCPSLPVLAPPSPARCVWSYPPPDYESTLLIATRSGVVQQ